MYFYLCLFIFVCTYHSCSFVNITTLAVLSIKGRIYGLFYIHYNVYFNVYCPPKSLQSLFKLRLLIIYIKISIIYTDVSKFFPVTEFFIILPSLSYFNLSFVSACSSALNSSELFFVLFFAFESRASDLSATPAEFSADFSL